MADIVIRGMEMPSNCLDCKIRRDWLTCPILDRYVMNNKTDRHPDCPLGPLPKGHGRCIDADALLSVLDILKDKGCDGPVWDQMRNIVESMVTIIPAEGGNKNG